jgi:hypothetical protein
VLSRLYISTSAKICYNSYLLKFTGENGCINNQGTCKRKYSDQGYNLETTFDEKGYPVYRRPTPADQRIIPHTRDILLDWDGHANSEFAASSYCVFYLYKYLYKGNRKVQLALKNTADLHDSDEINIFLRGRMLTSMDAMWRTFGYQTYPAPDPSIRLVKVILPKEMETILNDNHLTDLYVYFQRPASLRQMTLCQFFNNYCYKYRLTERRFITDDSEIADDGTPRYCHIPATSQTKSFYIYKRQRPQDCLTRLSGVPPDAGEIWYLRLLLREFATTSYKDLLSFGTTTYQTFQEAAYEKGLLADDTEAINTFCEAVLFQPPSGLRFLFVLLTCQGFPTLKIYETISLRENMYADFITQYSDNSLPVATAEANERLLEDLYDRFSRENKNMEDYGIPKPRSFQTELEREQNLVGDSATNRAWLNTLLMQAPNTEEMQEAYEEITSAIQNGESKFFFIRGCGGAGKTQFAKKVLHILYHYYISNTRQNNFITLV